jgi:hypothetical protein
VEKRHKGGSDPVIPLFGHVFYNDWMKLSLESGSIVSAPQKNAPPYANKVYSAGIRLRPHESGDQNQVRIGPGLRDYQRLRMFQSWGCCTGFRLVNVKIRRNSRRVRVGAAGAGCRAVHLLGAAAPDDAVNESDQTEECVSAKSPPIIKYLPIGALKICIQKNKNYHNCLDNNSH